MSNSTVIIIVICLTFLCLCSSSIAGGGVYYYEHNSPAPAPAPTPATNSLVLITRWYNASTGQHQDGISSPGTGWTQDTVSYNVFTKQVTGTVPVYLLQNPNNHNLYITTVIPNEATWTPVSTLGYAWSSVPTTKAYNQMYRMYNSSTSDHTTSLSTTEGAPAYAYDGTSFYAPTTGSLT